MNIKEKIEEVMKGMEGIGGVPTPSEYYAEFDMRVKSALGLVDSDFISNVRIRKCTNCIFSTPNAYSKYGHDRYFCNEGVQKNVQTITSPENHNCNRHRFNDES